MSEQPPPSDAQWRRQQMSPRAGAGVHRPAGRVMVLHDGPNPSVDVYLRPRLMARGMPPCTFVDIARERPADHDLRLSKDGSGTFVVICRYITADWLSALERAREILAGVAHFIDDDLTAMQRDPTLPPRYRFRIWRRYGRHAARLQALAGMLWVGSPVLAGRYRRQDATLLSPLYVPGPQGRAAPVRYFYHGTASHSAEIKWLREIVAEVQRREPRMLFEIAGGRRVRALFHGIERVVVLRPMNWPTYLLHSATSTQAIGLAPLMSSPVNEARSPTRFYDITRIGAAGLYSRRPPYEGFVRDGEDGILLPDDHDAWVAAILELAANPRRRRDIARAARMRCAVRDDTLTFLAGREWGRPVSMGGGVEV